MWKWSSSNWRQILPASAALLAVVFSAGCGPGTPPPRPAAAPARTKSIEDLNRFRRETIGGPVTTEPWVAHVAIVDLDRDGRPDVLVAESRENNILWLRQQPDGTFIESVIASDMRAPVQVEAVDIDGDDDLDVLVSSMGAVFPNNDRIGSVIVLENDGHQKFTPHFLLENVARVTDVRAGDFNGDGQLDLAVAQFGYDQGEIRWMERTGPWTFTSHILLNLSGAINVGVADMNGDRTVDIVALVSQQWEEVYLFANNGKGAFTSKVLFGSTNEDFASSNLRLGDLNRDGRPDIMFTNGDGFGPAIVAGPRPWHGVQWLENNGNSFFTFHRIGYLPGAYSPVAVDLDRDGAMDVVALSAFNEWEKPVPPPVSMVWFRNDGRQNFTPHVLAYKPTHLLTVDAGDLDGSGRPSLVTGAFHSYPPFENMTRLSIWRPVNPP